VRLRDPTNHRPVARKRLAHAVFGARRSGFCLRPGGSGWDTSKGFGGTPPPGGEGGPAGTTHPHPTPPAPRGSPTLKRSLPTTFVPQLVGSKATHSQAPPRNLCVRSVPRQSPGLPLLLVPVVPPLRHLLRGSRDGTSRNSGNWWVVGEKFPGEESGAHSLSPHLRNSFTTVW